MCHVMLILSVYDLIFISGNEADGGEKAAKPVITAGDFL